jgi:hypothetical protein
VCPATEIKGPSAEGSCSAPGVHAFEVAVAEVDVEVALMRICFMQELGNVADACELAGRSSGTPVGYRYRWVWTWS